MKTVVVAACICCVALSVLWFAAARQTGGNELVRTATPQLEDAKSADSDRRPDQRARSSNQDLALEAVRRVSRADPLGRSSESIPVERAKDADWMEKQGVPDQTEWDQLMRASESSLETRASAGDLKAMNALGFRLILDRDEVRRDAGAQRLREAMIRGSPLAARLMGESMLLGTFPGPELGPGFAAQKIILAIQMGDGSAASRITHILPSNPSSYSVMAALRGAHNDWIELVLARQARGLVPTLHIRPEPYTEVDYHPPPGYVSPRG